MTFFTKSIMLIGGLVFLAACAGTPSSRPTYTSYQAATADEKATIILNASGQRCDLAIFKLVNRETSEETKVNIKRTGSRRGNTPAVVSVSPGVYDLMGGTCYSSGFEPLYYRGLNVWFDGLEVEAGEVRNLGDLQIGAASASIPKSALARGLTAVVQWDFSAVNTYQYTVFAFRDRTERANARIRELFPDFTDQLTYEPLEPLISVREFSKLLKTNFGQDAEGEQRTRVEAELLTYDHMARLKQEALGIEE